MPCCCCSWESELHVAINQGMQGGALSIIMMEQQLDDFLPPIGEGLENPDDLIQLQEPSFYAFHGTPKSRTPIA